MVTMVTDFWGRQGARGEGKKDRRREGGRKVRRREGLVFFYTKSKNAIAFFTTGPGWVLKCTGISFWHSNLPYILYKIYLYIPLLFTWCFNREIVCFAAIIIIPWYIWCSSFVSKHYWTFFLHMWLSNATTIFCLLFFQLYLFKIIIFLITFII